MWVSRLLCLLSCLFLVLMMPEACRTARPISSSTLPTISFVTSVGSSSIFPNTSSSSPTVVSADLPADTSGTWIGPDATINFSIPMDKNATAKASCVSPQINNVVSWENNNTTMVIHPLTNWVVLTDYTITIAHQAQSADGSQMKQDYSASFMIGAMPDPPTVISTDPANNEGNVDPTGVIQIFFSKPMDTKATDQSLTIIPNTDLSEGYAILWDTDNQRLNFYFAQNMKPGEEYTITVTSQAISADGVYMQGSYTFVFHIMAC